MRTKINLIGIKLDNHLLQEFMLNLIADCQFPIFDWLLSLRGQLAIGNQQLAISNRQSLARFGRGCLTKLISICTKSRRMVCEQGTMGNHFIKVSRADEFNNLVERSQEQPVVIFKHSTTCSISAAAYREMEQFPGEVVLVEVQQARELSREIEKQTGIRHESPQVLVLENGKVVWSGSHFQVKARTVAEAVGTNRTQQA